MQVRIAPDSLSLSAQVDHIPMKLGDDYVKVTAAQKQRLEEAGVKLETKPVDTDSEKD